MGVGKAFLFIFVRKTCGTAFGRSIAVEDNLRVSGITGEVCLEVGERYRSLEFIFFELFIIVVGAYQYR